VEGGGSPSEGVGDHHPRPLGLVGVHASLREVAGASHLRQVQEVVRDLHLLDLEVELVSPVQYHSLSALEVAPAPPVDPEGGRDSLLVQHRGSHSALEAVPVSVFRVLAPSCLQHPPRDLLHSLEL
jgi:hypothetical protein